MIEYEVIECDNKTKFEKSLNEMQAKGHELVQVGFPLRPYSHLYFALFKKYSQSDLVVKNNE